jgi:hypothetical protein
VLCCVVLCCVCVVFCICLLVVCSNARMSGGAAWRVKKKSKEKTGRNDFASSRCLFGKTDILM